MLAKIEQGRKAPSAATLAGLAAGLGIEAPDLAHRANAWQAFASSGTSLAALRAGTIGGTLGIRTGSFGAALMPLAVITAGVYAVAKQESRKRRVLEQLLRTSLEQLSDADLDEVDLNDIADRLGVEMPVESSEESRPATDGSLQ